MSKLIIARDIAERFPGTFVVSLRVSGLNPGALPPLAATALEDECASIQARFGSSEAIADIPEIRVWREIYAKAGVKPSKFRSSIEALVRRALRGDQISVMPLVDIYNAISLRHMVPMGATDADLLGDLPVELRLCDPQKDVFQPLGSDASEFPLLATIPVYATGTTLLSWCFNCRDSRCTALHANSRNVNFYSEGITDWQLERAVAGMEDLAKLLNMAEGTSAISITKAPDV